MENEILVTISFPIMIQMDVKTKYKAKKRRLFSLILMIPYVSKSQVICQNQSSMFLKA